MSQETLRNRTVVGDFFDSRTKAQKDVDNGVPSGDEESPEASPNHAATTSSMVPEVPGPSPAPTSLAELEAREAAEAAKEEAFRLQREGNSVDGGPE